VLVVVGLVRHRLLHSGQVSTCGSSVLYDARPQQPGTLRLLRLFFTSFTRNVNSGLAKVVFLKIFAFSTNLKSGKVQNLGFLCVFFFQIFTICLSLNFFSKLV